MKDRKRFLLVFAICWVIGLVGGYFLGVGSALLPAENVDYNYYFSEKPAGTEVEPISKNCADQPKKDAATAEDEDHFVVILKNVDLSELPKRLVKKCLDKK